VGHVEYPNVTAALDALQPARPLGVANAFGNLMRRDVKARIVDKFDDRGDGQRDVAPLVSAASGEATSMEELRTLMGYGAAVLSS